MINDLKHYMGGEVLFLLSPYGPVLCFPVRMIPIEPFDKSFKAFILRKIQKSLSLSIPSFYLFDHFLYQRNAVINSN